MRGTVFVGMSVDGFIARPDGAFDFLSGSGEGPMGFEELLASVDALVMGRNTYDVVLPMERWPYGALPVFVLSHRPLPPGRDGVPVERLSGDPAEVAAALEARGLTRLYVDGGLTVQEWLRAGLIHRIVVTRVPVLIGEGIPLFGPVERDVRLRHVATRAFEGGAVQTEYEVVAPTPAAASVL